MTAYLFPPGPDAKPEAVLRVLITRMADEGPDNLDAELIRTALRVLKVDEDEALADRVFSAIFHLFFKELYAATFEETRPC